MNQAPAIANTLPLALAFFVIMTLSGLVVAVAVKRFRRIGWTLLVLGPSIAALLYIASPLSPGYLGTAVELGCCLGLVAAMPLVAWIVIHFKLGLSADSSSAAESQPDVQQSDPPQPGLDLAVQIPAPVAYQALEGVAE